MATNIIKHIQRLTLGSKQLHRCIHNVSTQGRIHMVPPSSVFSSVNYLDKLQTQQSNEAVQLPATYQMAGLGNKEYSLPGSSSHSKNKIIILDPSMSSSGYQLPTAQTTVTEKVSPALINITPKEDPLPLGRNEEKQASNSHIIRIRRRMHKRNKRQRTKARDVFINRKESRLKHQKWDARIVVAEKKWAERGEAYNAMRHMGQMSALARLGGYRVDVVQEYFAAQKDKGS